MSSNPFIQKLLKTRYSRIKETDSEERKQMKTLSDEMYKHIDEMVDYGHLDEGYAQEFQDDMLACKTLEHLEIINEDILADYTEFKTSKEKKEKEPIEAIEDVNSGEKADQTFIDNIEGASPMEVDKVVEAAKAMNLQEKSSTGSETSTTAAMPSSNGAPPPSKDLPHGAKRKTPKERPDYPDSADPIVDIFKEDEITDKDGGLTREELAEIAEADRLIRVNPEHQKLHLASCVNCRLRTQRIGSTDKLCSQCHRSIEEKALRKILSAARLAEKEKKTKEEQVIRRAALLRAKRLSNIKVSRLRRMMDKTDASNS